MRQDKIKGEETYAKAKNSVVQPNSIDQAQVAGITLVEGLHDDGIFLLLQN